MVKRLEDMSLEEVGQWLVETCLMFGTQVSTAHQVAATFVKGLEAEGREYPIAPRNTSFQSISESSG